MAHHILYLSALHYISAYCASFGYYSAFLFANDHIYPSKIVRTVQSIMSFAARTSVGNYLMMQLVEISDRDLRTGRPH